MLDLIADTSISPWSYHPRKLLRIVKRKPISRNLQQRADRFLAGNRTPTPMYIHADTFKSQLAMLAVGSLLSG